MVQNCDSDSTRVRTQQKIGRNFGGVRPILKVPGITSKLLKLYTTEIAWAIGFETKFFQVGIRHGFAFGKSTGSVR